MENRTVRQNIWTRDLIPKNLKWAAYLLQVAIYVWVTLRLIGGFMVLLRRTGPWGGDHWVYSIWIGVWIVFTCVATRKFIFHLAMRLHEKELKRRADAGLCLHCGYDLRGLTWARCPECSTPFLFQQPLQNNTPANDQLLMGSKSATRIDAPGTAKGETVCDKLNRSVVV